MTGKIKIALIELNVYHEECLFSQIEFLNNTEYELSLFLNSKNSSNAAYYNISKKNIFYIKSRHEGNFINRIFRWFSLFKHLKKERFDKVIFNTASSNKEIIFLTLFLPKKIKLFGTIHDLKKLNHSSSQKVISKRIKNYFVLNDYLTDTSTIIDNKIKLNSFYPIFYPKYKEVSTIEKDNAIWVCIPGELDYNRRNYNIIINALKHFIPSSPIKFIILGKMNSNHKDVVDFNDQIIKNNLQTYFVTFNEFIPNELFHSYIKKSDYIMAPISVKEQNYLKNKITGAYNLAFGYKKPLICPKELENIPDLKSNSLFYTDALTLMNLLKELPNKIVVNNDWYPDKKWSFEFQKINYLKHLD